MKGIFSEKFFRVSGFITIALIFFLVFLGGLVRITGSGMGCPDWPKCFGYYVPPTQIEQLTWAPGREYKKGQMIINSERLLVAKSNFTTGNTFDEAQWEVYTKHDYAQFDPVNTYIEYVNRLFGALTGFFMLLTMISSFQYWKKRKAIVWLSFISFLLVLFQGWVGAKVVESNLEGFKVSLHMLLAFATAALVMITIYKDHAARNLERLHNLRLLKGLVYSAIALTMLQIYFGTQVREAVDHVGTQNPDWTSQLGQVFGSHKAMAVFVLAIMLVIFYLVSSSVQSSNKAYRFVAAGLLLTVLQIITGSLNIFFNMPAASQLLHITLSGLLAGSQFYVAILLYNYKQTDITGEVLESN